MHFKSEFPVCVWWKYDQSETVWFICCEEYKVYFLVSGSLVSRPESNTDIQFVVLCRQ